MNVWQGDKIRLRAVELSDVDNYFCKKEFYDSEDERKGDKLILPRSRELMVDRVTSLAKQDPYGDECFLIIEDLEGNPVGNINTHSVSVTDGVFSYGLGVKKCYTNNGYATEAIKILLQFYFMERGFHKVEVEVFAFNEASIALHEKFGFVLEGTLRENHYTMGKWHDALCYGLLKDEFMDKYTLS